MSVQTFTDMLGATILAVEGAKRGSEQMREKKRLDHLAKLVKRGAKSKKGGA